MVIQKTLNNLKGGAKEDKVAVASGVAISVVVLLLALWAFYFLHRIASGSQQLNLTGGVQSQFNFQNVTQAQQQLQQQFGSPTDDLQEVRAQSQEGNGGQMQDQQMQVQGQGGTDQFGTQQ